MTKKTTYLSKLEVDFTIEVDEKGFSINCDVVEGINDFDESMVPALTLHYIRMLCKETGISFEKALRSSLGITDQAIEAKAQA